MSNIMEKTLASLPKLLAQSFIGNKSSKQPRSSSVSPEVQNFMKCVHRAKSKTHEAAIVSSELSDIQAKLKQTEYISSSLFLRSSFSKALFCHLLGYDVSFIAVTAINLAGQQGLGQDKRFGYLLSSLLLHPGHQMVLLMTANLLRDLKSSNMTDNLIALAMTPNLVNSDNVAILLPQVVKRLSHSQDLVKERAVHCLRSLYLRAPEQVLPAVSQLTALLTCRDPGVLTAVVNMYLLLLEQNATNYVHLGPSFLHILQQINGRGFGSNYYHHMVPLPWLQISILKVLRMLGNSNTQLSLAMQPHLEALMEKTKVSEPLSLAVLVEAVLTATSIPEADSLLPLCSRCVGKLLDLQVSPGLR